MFSRISNKKINIKGQNYNYTLRRRPRTKYVKLTIEHDGALVITAPVTYPMFLIKRFLNNRYQWILKNVAKIKANPTILGIKHSEAEIKKYKQRVRLLVEERLKYFNQFYNLKIQRISIRNQKSRWGSCSSKGNLNFNYRLYFLPAQVADYIIVHELCHLQEMNHSRQFWVLVARSIPDYKNRQKLLKKI